MTIQSKICTQDNVNPSRGFTMLEIIAVLVILGVISAVAVSRMGGLGITAYGDADRLVSDLRYAQTLAMTRAYKDDALVNTVEVTINSDGWKFSGGSWRFADGEEERNVRWGVEISGSENVAFNYPFGDLDGGDKELTLKRGGTTIIVQVDGNTGFVEIKK